jgi:hypothetical protein
MSLNNFQQLSPDERQTALDAPALQPPAGTQADFDNPPNRNIIPHAVIPICLILVISTMLLRAYARVFLLKRVNVDDGGNPSCSLFLVAF